MCNAAGSNSRNKMSFAASGLCMVLFTAFLGLTLGLDEAKSWSLSPMSSSPRTSQINEGVDSLADTKWGDGQRRAAA